METRNLRFTFFFLIVVAVVGSIANAATKCESTATSYEMSPFIGFRGSIAGPDGGREV